MNLKNLPKYDIVAIAHALVDVLAYVDQDFLNKHNLKKGSMTLISTERALYLSEHLRYIKMASGGSASNTMAGIASFGAKSAVIGKVKDDELGAIFKRDVGMCGVDFCGTTEKTGDPTGRCFVAVSKDDAERTMSTYLGISTQISERDIKEQTIANTKVIYFEGYLLDDKNSKKALEKTIDIAKKYNKFISMTLSDARCVIEHREDIFKLLKNVNLLFANELEIKTLFETEDLDLALKKIADICDISTVTMGKLGSVVIKGKERYNVRAEADPKKIVDTTGAGDLYASGFLYGYIKGMSLETSAKLGNMAAAEVISHMGARPEITLSSLLKKI